MRVFILMRLWVLGWLLFFSLGRSGAEEKNPLQVEMISEVTQIQAGRTFWVGFHLHHPPNHHSYWRHPGVVGVATSIVWQLPPGFSAGAILWPAPQKVMMSIHPAQGYRGDVLLMVPITAPAALPDGPIELRAQLDWMCCHTSCHPAHAVPFALTLPHGSREIRHAANEPIFANARRLVPRPNPQWLAQADVTAQQIQLTIRPAAGNPRSVSELGALWFFSADGAIDSSAPQTQAVQADGSLRMTLQRYEFGPHPLTQMTGVLQAAAGWDAESQTPCIEINAAIKN